MPTVPPKPKRALFPIRFGRRGFARDDRGSTAIEFGILALPFFAIIGAMLETSLVFFAGQVLDSSLHDAARKIRTGQAQSYLISDFRTEMCGRLYSLFDCSKLRIVVTTLVDFSSAGVPANASPLKPNPCNPATDPTQCWNVAETFTAGSSSSVMLVRAYYRWPTIISIGGFNLADQTDNSRLLGAVRVFQNEPY